MPLVLCRQSSQRKRSKYPRGTVSVGASAVSHQSRQNGLNLEPEYTIKDNFLTSLHHHLKIWKGKHILGVHHGPKGPVLASGLLGRHPAGEDRPAVTFRASERNRPWLVRACTAWSTESHACERLAEGRCVRAEWPAIEPATFRSPVQHPTCKGLL